MIIYYRISSNSYNKPRIPGATKSVCLKNFLEIFHGENICLIKDNCDESIEKEIGKVLKDYPDIKIEVTQLGNSGSFKYALSQAITHDPNEIVYFVEDDYLHESNAKKILLEGLKVGDYATLYDHPDKYCSEYYYGETTKILHSGNHHWKHSISTTMTFATKVKILQEDANVWIENSTGPHPDDHHAFCQLDSHRAATRRKLAVAIPGLAFHSDLSAYHLFPPTQMPNIEQWAIEYLKKTLTRKIYSCNDGDMEDAMHDVIRGKMDGVPLLICLDQILQTKKIG